MCLSAVLGFPRMGRDRELKKAIESYWSGRVSEADLLSTARSLRVAHWRLQRDAGVDVIPSNDHALYDHLLDHSILFNAIPARYRELQEHKLSDLDLMFAMGRGLQRPAADGKEKLDVPSQEMVKWFDSNYHVFRGEWSPSSDIRLPSVPKPVAEFNEAKDIGIHTRPVLVGPISLLYLAKADKDAPAGFQPLSLLDRLLPVYAQLLNQLVDAGADSIQIDEPILVFDLPASVLQLYQSAYAHLSKAAPRARLMLTTYFGEVADVSVLKGLPVAGIHIDLARARHQLDAVIQVLDDKQTLSLGVVDGRNIWKCNMQDALHLVQQAVSRLGSSRVLVATSSSLLHTPHTLASEGSGPGSLDPAVRDWFAFASEKCAEVSLLARAMRDGCSSVQTELNANAKSLLARSTSAIAVDEAVRSRQRDVTPAMQQRTSVFTEREKLQAAHLRLPLFPTTTIGSFPQTKEIRVARDQFTKGLITQAQYDEFIRDEIRNNVRIQEEIGLDVLVHGEPERNDMVQFFLERMRGCCFTRAGWVQSYGTRCVRPPIIVGDVSRPEPMTVKEAVFAASLTDRPMKGMLTGPITCLRWSFPRDDLSLHQQCQQLALAIRDEVADLEAAGLRVLQIDEPALREGLPLRQRDQADYLEWAVACFKLATCCVQDSTQIHSHFCYSDFNSIFPALQALDADAITIESSKSDLKLLAVLDSHGYTNQIGPGVYDIHSPRVPSSEEIGQRVQAMLQYIRAPLLWINPDCGLKTRAWPETKEALTNMVRAAHKAREAY